MELVLKDFFSSFVIDFIYTRMTTENKPIIMYNNKVAGEISVGQYLIDCRDLQDYTHILESGCYGNCINHGGHC